MNALVMISKRCPRCDAVKPLSEFHKCKTSPDGHAWWCKPCVRANTVEKQALRREQMGEEAWLAHQREIQRRSRERTGNATGLAYQRARSRAQTALLHRHRAEFDHLFLLAQRGEL